MNDSIRMSKSVVIFSVLVLFYTTRASSQLQQCTSGFVEDIKDVSGNLTILPSPERQELDFVQWIFPFVRFTCRSKLTRWSLRVEQLGDLDLEQDDQWNIPQLSVWRPSEDTDLSQRQGTFKLQSSTNETLFSVNNNGPTFEYNLRVPVIVEPGDIVGVRMPLDDMARRMRSTRPLFKELERGDISTRSYIRLNDRTVVMIVSEGFERAVDTIVPLISVRIEPPDLPKTPGSATNGPSFMEDMKRENSSGDFTTGIAIDMAVIAIVGMLAAVFVATAVVMYFRCKKQDKSGEREEQRQEREDSPVYETIEDYDNGTSPHIHSTNRVQATTWQLHDVMETHRTAATEYLEPQDVSREGNTERERDIETSENMAYVLVDQKVNMAHQDDTEKEHTNLGGLVVQ